MFTFDRRIARDTVSSHPSRKHSVFFNQEKLLEEYSVPT